MNDHNNDQPADEPLLDPLRSSQPPVWVRVANREAARCAAEAIAPPWWRRSVSVPLPVAVATAAVLVLTTVGAVWPRALLPSQSAVSESDKQPTKTVYRFADDEGAQSWRVSHSYLRSLASAVDPSLIALDQEELL